MILPMFRRRSRSGTIAALYGAIVAQARQPAFYAQGGVPDTLDGRFELIVLHLALVLRRLGAAERAFGQALFDAFCADMDANLRELGFADLAVPREMKRIGEAFYGRLAAYEAAFNDGVPALAGALARNVLGRPEADAAAGRLADYTWQAGRLLADTDRALILDGQVVFPAVVLDDHDRQSGTPAAQEVAS